MIAGVPKEIKREEYRVGMTPYGIQEIIRDGHTVLIESGAGEGSGFSNEEYTDAGAHIVDREVLFRGADLIVKVKEPLPSEYDLLREGQAVFTYLHLAAAPELARVLLDKRVTAIGYETLQKDGTLPLLAPMSEIAGRMAPLMGAYYLQRIHGGKGILASGAVGVRPAKVLILGAGVVGTNAARISIGFGMDTVVINRGGERLHRLDEIFEGRLKTIPLTAYNLSEEIRDADIVIGAILVAGGRTPVLVTRDMLKTMERGSVIVDVSVDQGGCVETSMPTTHDRPVYEVDGIIHYTVANMPGAYPRTSTIALTNATLPYIKTLLNKGIEGALREDPSIMTALNTYAGEVVHKALAESMGLECRRIDENMV